MPIENNTERRQSLQAALQAFVYAPLAEISARPSSSLDYASQKTANLGNTQ